MRTVPYCLICLALLVCQLLPAQNTPESSWSELSPTLRCRATGNGQATGQIGSIQVINSGSEAVPIQPQVFFIPSDGKHQGYLARIPAGLTAAPNTETTLPIIGYCTDIDKPAVPATYPLPAPKFWYPVQPDTRNTTAGAVRVLSGRAELPPFSKAQIADIKADKSYRQLKKKTDWKLRYPGTEELVDGTLQVDQAAEVTAPLLYKINQLLEQRYEQLAEQQLIRTPLSADRLKERETIIQHTLWIWIAQLCGSSYTYEDFAQLVDQEIQGLSTGLNTESDTQQEAASKTLWSTFHRLIYQSELSNQLPSEVAQFPTLLDLPDWSTLDLTGAYRKPALLTPNSTTTAAGKKRTLWLPIAGGLVLGSGITYFVLNDDPAPPVDTIVLPPPLDTLKVVDDEYTVDCQPPATLFPLQNDQGTRIRIRSIGPTGDVVVEQFGDDALIINDFGGQTDFSFLINVEDSLGNTQSGLVRVMVDLPEIAASNDSFSTAYLTPFSGNILANDTGDPVSILSYDPPPNGLALMLEPDGNLSGTPMPGFTGQFSFNYIIEDNCLQQDTATVTITVGEPDCDFTAKLTPTPADCGFSNGGINTAISPENDYTYGWSNGDTTVNLSSLPAGSYTLTVTSNAGLCEQTFNTTVGEQPISYLLSQNSTPGNCTGGGDIVLELTSPEDESLVVAWMGPAGDDSQIVAPGTSHLGQLTNLLPGDYDIVIYPEIAGPSCADSTMISVGDSTLLLLANLDQFMTPYETSLNGNVMLNDMGQNINLTANTDPTNGNLTIDANGQFTFTPPDDFTGDVSFTYTITDLCGNTELGQVTINIGPPDCDFTIFLTAVDSDCGLNNGNLSSIVTPEDTYTYAWSNGGEGPDIEDLSPGVYSLTVSSEGGLCESTSDVEIEEQPIRYLIEGTVTPGTCIGNGNISLLLESPEDLPLTLQITGSSGTSTFEVMPGMVELSSLINLPAGNYTISLYPTAAGSTCAENVAYLIPDNSPMLNVANENYSTNFQTPVNDNLLTNDSGLNLAVSNVTDIVGGVVNFQADGTFIYVPFNDFTGTGSFNYTVTDACGNTASGNVTIEVGAPDCIFDVQVMTTAANCGLADGSITTIAVPEETYTFMWSTGAETPSIDQLATGEYLLTVTTNSGLCTQTYSALVGEMPAAYIVNATTSPGNCNGGGNITLELSAPDGSNFGGVLVGPGVNQTLDLNAGINQLNESFNLLPGSYSVTVYSITAGFQCNETIDLTIADATPTIFTVNDNFVTAFNTPISDNFLSNDGGLDIEVSSVGSVPNGTLMHQPDGSFTFTPDLGFAGFTGFSYTIIDACGQTLNGNVTINVRPPTCNYTVELEVFNAVCELPNGMINAIVSPAGDYSYEWSNGATTSSIEDLAVGDYTVSVTGNNGFCVIDAMASIIEGPPVFVDSLSTAPGDCAGNGSIIVEAYAPGNATLDVIVNGPNGSDIITIPSGFSNLGDLVNLPSGVYDLVFFPTAVGLSCTEETFAIVEDNSPPLIVNDDSYFTPFQLPLVDNVLLNDDGLLVEVVSIDNVDGGTVDMSSNGDFVFTPFNGATQPASFTYSATDACNQVQIGVVNIEIGPSNCNFSLGLNKVNAGCGTANGSLTAVVSPSGDYSYEWSNGSTDDMIDNLAAGAYGVTVIDNTDDCPLSLRDTIIENSANYISNLEVNPANCNSDATIEFILDASTPRLYTLDIEQPNGMTLTLENTTPGLFQLQNFLTIEPGTYQITTFNQNVGENCLDSITAIVPDPLPNPAIAIDNIVQPSSPVAMDGSFEVVFTTLSSGPYQVNVNGQNVGQSDGNAFLWDNLPVGTYEVFVTDANGCISSTQSVTLTSATTLRLGWSSPGLIFGVVEPEGLLQQFSSQGVPFAEIVFNSGKNHSYRLRLQQFSLLNTSTIHPQAIFMDLQLVQPTALFQGKADPKSRWYLANGLSLFQLGGNVRELFLHNTLSWQPNKEQQLEIVLDSYLGRQFNIQLGLQHLW
ncbi:MAG: Ig-like domain-containing protein [Bacteroidota bacterium]